MPKNPCKIDSKLWELFEALRVGISPDEIINEIKIFDYRTAIYHIRKKIEGTEFVIPYRENGAEKWRFERLIQGDE